MIPEQLNGCITDLLKKKIITIFLKTINLRNIFIILRVYARVVVAKMCTRIKIVKHGCIFFIYDYVLCVCPRLHYIRINITVATYV